MEMFEPRLNREKFKGLILYVARKCVRDEGFGKTKLNKVLWWSDFQAFARLGESITGAKYMRLPWGPAPTPLLPVLKSMEDDGLVTISARATRGGHTQERVRARREPDLSLFSKAEIKLVDRVIDALWDKRAVGVSNLSHKKSVGWTLAQDREIIPYETVFLSSRKPSAADRKWARETAKIHGWT
jgi:hypothetical protein